MKTKFAKLYSFIFIIALFLAMTTVYIYGNSSGFTGRTLKSSASGCGGCHGSSSTSDVTVTIAGPDSVVKGQTALFSVTVNKQSKNGAGIDVSARNGNLSPVSSTLQLLNGELTNNANIPMTSGSVTLQFNYTAPSVTGTDTIWATGLATNSNNNSSGDDWNWAPSKRVVIRDPIGIIKITGQVPVKYLLKQNFPNPFNPETRIRFSLPLPTSIRLIVYDVNGKEVETLGVGRYEAGEYQAVWNASNYPSGIYFCKIKSDNYNETRKMILVK